MTERFGHGRQQHGFRHVSNFESPPCQDLSFICTKPLEAPSSVFGGPSRQRNRRKRHGDVRTEGHPLVDDSPAQALSLCVPQSQGPRV